jgi:uncharacterized protein YjiS (DUF1127 family)
MPTTSDAKIRSNPMSAQILKVSALAGRFPGDATLPEIRRSAFTCFNTVAAWTVRSNQRRALRALAQDGRLLSDIGLTREQALREAGKPFWRR